MLGMSYARLDHWGLQLQLPSYLQTRTTDEWNMTDHDASEYDQHFEILGMIPPSRELKAHIIDSSLHN